MRFRHDDEIHIAVEAAVEGEIGHLRVDAVVCAVVDGDCEGVFIFQSIGEVGAEGRVAALVMGESLSVQRDVGGHGGAEEFDEAALAGFKFRLFKCLRVDGGAAPVVVSAVLSVDGVPGVGEGHGGCRFAGFCEFPVVVEA